MAATDADVASAERRGMMPRKAKRVSTHEQLPLASFTIQPPRQEAIANVTWSYSKRSLFERCQRRYYYEYYGSTTALEGIEPQHVTLRRLKALVGRHERVGTLLHRGIATYLHRAQAGTTKRAHQLVDWLAENLPPGLGYFGARS